MLILFFSNLLGAGLFYLDIVWVNLCHLPSLQGATRGYKVRRINTLEYELMSTVPQRRDTIWLICAYRHVSCCEKKNLYSRERFASLHICQEGREKKHSCGVRQIALAVSLPTLVLQQQQQRINKTREIGIWSGTKNEVMQTNVINIRCISLEAGPSKDFIGLVRPRMGQESPQAWICF